MLCSTSWFRLPEKRILSLERSSGRSADWGTVILMTATTSASVTVMRPVTLRQDILHLSAPNRGNASEFISRALEEHVDSSSDRKTYADYIATRPRAERFGSHGLFTDDGVQVCLEKVSKELNLHRGNIWTVIISLRREDAERLGFDHGERWRDLLRAQTQEFAEQFHIPLNDLKWFAAFHNEGHHPHVHLLVYSREPKQGFLSEKGVQKLRSSLAREIFAQDLLQDYQAQTKHRDELKKVGRETISEIISQINTGAYDNPVLESKLQMLAERLSKTSGKKVYGYLKADVKALVDDIVSELAADERISALYDLWYQRKENAMSVYRSDMPERIPLANNPEFKSVKNMVIREAMHIVNGTIPQEPEEDENICLERSAEQRNGAAEYRLGRICLTDNDVRDVDAAIRYLTAAAEKGNSSAKYQLGKLFLFRKDGKEDVKTALSYLTSASRHGNQYAAQLLHSIETGRNWAVALGSLRLLRGVSGMFKQSAEQRQRTNIVAEQKLLSAIEEKRRAHGLKHS